MSRLYRDEKNLHSLMGVVVRIQHDMAGPLTGMIVRFARGQYTIVTLQGNSLCGLVAHDGDTLEAMLPARGYISHSWGSLTDYVDDEQNLEY